jgi:hypothetical protein
MKFKTLIVSMILLGNFYSISCADLKFKVSDIPSELKENAKAVVRYEKIEFEVVSQEKAISRVNLAITVLNKNGLDYSKFIQFYNKFFRISDIHAVVYNENGEKVKKIFFDDFYDISAINGFSLYEDSRVKYVDPEYEVYPFTVEYSYEILHNGYLNFPEWQPYKDFNISTQESEFRVIVPLSYKLRYLEKNITNPCIKTTSENKSIYLWQAKNLKAPIKEDFGLESEEYLPIVYVAPSDFEISGYSGNMESWQRYGKWILEMNKGRDELDADSRENIIKLINGVDTEMKKLKILYEFMQNKVRYVSVQVGIGGWQPFEAKIVDKYSYGDCKALSNYMKSILEVAGIPSFYTLIKAGSEKPFCITDFPINQFNHAILCVPMNNDTVWLECTSQDIPFGYLGTFTDDRAALIITDSGGVLVHTPVLNIEDNVKVSSATVYLEKDGIWSTALISTQYKGLFYDEMRKFIKCDDADRKKFLEENLKIPSFELIGYKSNEIKTSKPFLELNLSLNLNKQGTLLNDRLIIPLNLLNKKTDLPLKTLERKSDIRIIRSYQTIDTIMYIIPKEYFIEQIPAAQKFSSEFGTYEMQILQTESSLTYIRRNEMYQGLYPASHYDKLLKFFNDIEKCDNTKMILRKSLK